MTSLSKTLPCKSASALAALACRSRNAASCSAVCSGSCGRAVDGGCDGGKRARGRVLCLGMRSHGVGFRLRGEALNAVQMRLRERFLVSLLARLSDLRIERRRFAGNLRRQHALEPVRNFVRAGPIHIARHKIGGHARSLRHGLDELQHAVRGLGAPCGIRRADLHPHIVGALAQIVEQHRLTVHTHHRHIDAHRQMAFVLAHDADGALAVVNLGDEIDQHLAEMVQRRHQIVLIMQR